MQRTIINIKKNSVSHSAHKLPVPPVWSRRANINVPLPDANKSIKGENCVFEICTFRVFAIFFNASNARVEAQRTKGIPTGTTRHVVRKGETQAMQFRAPRNRCQFECCSFWNAAVAVRAPQLLAKTRPRAERYSKIRIAMRSVYTNENTRVFHVRLPTCVPVRREIIPPEHVSPKLKRGSLTH